jgi:predicted component of type VI protein secretion system
VAVFKFRNLKSGQATPIPPGEFTIGRADDAYIHLEDGSVSRRHAQIINNSAGFFIEDLGSANGTAARGSYITRRININYGDEVYIGSVPFRIDPEVAGDVDSAPSAGLRNANRSYIRRDTERLPPNITASPVQVIEPISPEKLSAPEVSASIDIDAGDLNAITIREPESVPEHAQENLETEPAAKRVPAEITPPARSTFSVPTPQRPARPQPASTTPPSVQTVPIGTTTGWGRLLLVFWAGMGTGLLIGLVFARLFIEMGGKAASLP